MYPRSRTKNYNKRDMAARWNLTDRVFFACGACHILAYAFMQKYTNINAKAIWLKPHKGYTGNHIFVEFERTIFDYHGYSNREEFLKHTFKRAQHYWPGWDADLIELPEHVLVSEKISKTYEGLWLREPKQFLHDALPRADKYLNKFLAPNAL